MLKIIIDSNADLPADVANQHHLHIAPAWVQLKTRRVRTDSMDNRDLRAQVIDMPGIPRTDPLTEDEYAEIFSRLLKDHDRLLFITSSSGITQLFERANRAAQRVAPSQITLYDSRGISLWAGFLALRAAQMTAEGRDLDTILKVLDQMREQSQLFFIVDNLAYLHRGGRVNLAQYMLGFVFDIRPILSVQAGRVVPVARERGRGRVIVRMQTLLLEAIQGISNLWLGVVHVDMPDMAQRLAHQLQDTLRPSYTLVSEAGPTVSAHTGSGTIGVIVSPSQVLHPQ
jgi:DegV family protein with EDD domain